MSDFKKQLDVTIGKAATILGEQTSKAAEFISDKKDKVADFLVEAKDKAVDYLDVKKEIYETKSALDAAKDKVEKLFNEIGRISFYGKAVTPERKRPLVKAELIAALDEVAALEEKYNSLYADEASVDQEPTDDEI